MSWEIRQGDALERLREMPDESVQCVCTSPPYWGLRDYGVDGQLGLEETPEQFIVSMVEVFAEVRRALRADGTLWLNLGDSYNTRQRGSDNGWDKSRLTNPARVQKAQRAALRPRRQLDSCKPKDLIGIPWLIAFALRADGWYLRRDIIWNKPNPMPESVTDRPTSSHEYLFLFAKGQRKSRVVSISDLHGERVHLGQHVGSHDPNLWANEFSVRLATSILDSPKVKEHFCLPPLDAQVWEERPGDRDGFGVTGLPVEHRAAVFAARLLSTHGTAEEFLGELDRLGVTLADHDKLLIGGGAAEFALPPGVNRYGKTAIAIHDSGEIGEIDWVAHTVKCSRPSGCSYFYDAEAIREQATWAGPHSPAKSPYGQGFAGRSAAQERKRQGKQRGHGRRHDGFNDCWDQMSKDEQQALGRNKRSVWTIATRPYPDAHFATFPPDLVEPCILAGTPPKVCGECGAPWVRTTERVPIGQVQKMADGWDTGEGGHGSIHRGGRQKGESGVPVLATVTTGWQPTCDHKDDSGRAVVLDPFAGAGTTSLVATQLGRDSIGIELNPTYAEMAEDRIRRWEANPAGHLKPPSAPLEGQGTIDELLQLHPEDKEEGAAA